MAVLQLQLPDRLKTLAETRAADAGFDSLDAYIASLIESDEAVPLSAELDAELIAGLDSGPAFEVTAGFWDDLKRRVRERRAPR
jgi:hypothetical protein